MEAHVTTYEQGEHMPRGVTMHYEKGVLYIEWPNGHREPTTAEQLVQRGWWREKESSPRTITKVEPTNEFVVAAVALWNAVYDVLSENDDVRNTGPHLPAKWRVPLVRAANEFKKVVDK